MATKEASVKMTLSSSAFLSAMRSTSQAVQNAGKKMGAALADAGKVGFGAMKKEMADMGSSLKSTIKTVATLGGAVSAGALVKGAVGLQSQFKDVAFAAKAGGKATLNWRVELENAQRVALTTGQTTADLGRAFKDLYGEVADVDFARDALEPIGTAASATGASMGDLTAVAGALRNQFGVTAKELPDALAAAVSMANQGGLSIEDMSARLSVLGATAKGAGMQGAGGLSTVVAMANQGVVSAGNVKKSLAAVATLLDNMGTDETRKKIRMKLHVDTRDKAGMQRDATKVLADIFKATGAKKEKLQAIFTGDQLKLVTDLGQSYRETFEKTSGTVKEKTAAATKAFETALKASGKAAISYADIQAEAAERAKDPQAMLADAVERVSVAFTKPEMLDAITRLSESLPKLADGLGAAAKFAAESPKLAVAALVGVKAGSAFLGAALTDLAKKAAKVTFGEGGGGGGKSAGGGRVTGGVIGNAMAVTGAFVTGMTVGELIAQKLVEPALAGTAKASEYSQLQSGNVDTYVRGLQSGRTSPEAAEKFLAEIKADVESAKLNSDAGSLVNALFGTGSLKEFTRNDELASLSKRGNPLGNAIVQLEAEIQAAKSRRELSADDISKGVAGALTGKTINVNIVGGGANPGGGTPNRGPKAPSPSRPGHGR